MSLSSEVTALRETINQFSSTYDDFYKAIGDVKTSSSVGSPPSLKSIVAWLNQQDIKNYGNNLFDLSITSNKQIIIFIGNLSKTPYRFELQNINPLYTRAFHLRSNSGEICFQIFVLNSTTTSVWYRALYGEEKTAYKNVKPESGLNIYRYDGPPS